MKLHPHHLYWCCGAHQTRSSPLKSVLNLEDLLLCIMPWLFMSIVIFKVILNGCSTSLKIKARIIRQTYVEVIRRTVCLCPPVNSICTLKAEQSVFLVRGQWSVPGAWVLSTLSLWKRSHGSYCCVMLRTFNTFSGRTATQLELLQTIQTNRFKVYHILYWC